MADREKVIKELEWQINVFTVYCASDERLLEAMKAALALLKEQDNWLGMRQTVDGITFISSGTAKQGEKRGIMLGKALVYERLEKELLYRGLLTDDIRSAFVKVWGELE